MAQHYNTYFLVQFRREINNLKKCSPKARKQIRSLFDKGKQEDMECKISVLNPTL